MQSKDVSRQLNDAPLGMFHLRAVLTAGMGFFTDAYDLFIIGAALVLIKMEWHLSSPMVGIVGSVALAASFVGAVVFGRLADMYGRKAVYGLEAALMALGALLSAVSPNLMWLIVSRFVLGIGIGGDYPVSAVLMSEYANTHDRGKLVSLVFSMQALGLLAGPVVAMTLLGSGIPAHWAWRLMLAVGAIPAAAVIGLRRHMPESPRYVALARRTGRKGAGEGQRQALGKAVATLRPKPAVAQGNWRQMLVSPHNLRLLVGTAGTWALFDYAYYGNSISMPFVLRLVAPHTTPMTSMAWSLIIFALAAVPGYVMAFLHIDQIGHKKLQWVGFFFMAAAFGAIALIPAVAHQAVAFLLLFGISYFFAEFGPNTTTFVLSAEVFPTSIRTTAHGLSAGIAKFGAFTGVFILPVLTAALGLRGTLGVTFVFCLAGGALTFVLPEPAGKSLEEMEENDNTPENTSKMA